MLHVVCRYILLLIPQGESGMIDHGFNMPVDIIIPFYKRISFLLLKWQAQSHSLIDIFKTNKVILMGIGQDIKYLLLIHLHISPAEPCFECAML